jgi:shikimate dehydrogenase
MKRLAVIGDPVGHSRSPAMQSAALAELGLAGEWSYEALEIAPEELAPRLRALAADPEWAGLNVTIPHKEAALALADEASPAAREIGAANTLSFRAGRIHAENTDAPGLLAALPRPAAGERALVLGAGGAARAAVWALHEEGAEVSVWNRTAARATALAEELGVRALAEGEGVELGALGILVNATSAGLGDRPQGGGGASSPQGGQLKTLGIEADGLHDRLVVVDLVYGSAETELVEAARAAGAETVDGLEILVRQGAASLEIWTGARAPLATMRRAVRPPNG